MGSVVILDMGGVLYDFQGDRMIQRLSRRRFRRGEEQQRWLPLLRSFEVGACSADDFAEQAVTVCDLDLSSAEFSSAFAAAAIGFYPGAAALMAGLAQHHRLLSLSNTNAIQWPRVMAGFSGADPFEAHHPSHLTGFRKPDRRAFEAVLATCAAEQPCFYFDDLPKNVSAASAAGLCARRVRGVVELARACNELGLLAG